MIYIIVPSALALLAFLIWGFKELNRAGKNYWSSMKEFRARAEATDSISDLVLLKDEIQIFYNKEAFHRCHFAPASAVTAFINGKISGLQKSMTARSDIRNNYGPR